MATIVNNPQPVREVRQVETGGGGGIVVALIVLVVLLALFFIFGRGIYRSTPAASNSPGVNVNVTPSSGGTSGGASGGSSGGGTTAQ